MRSDWIIVLTSKVSHPQGGANADVDADTEAIDNESDNAIPKQCRCQRQQSHTAKPVPCATVCRNWAQANAFLRRHPLSQMRLCMSLERSLPRKGDMLFTDTRPSPFLVKPPDLTMCERFVVRPEELLHHSVDSLPRGDDD